MITTIGRIIAKNVAEAQLRAEAGRKPAHRVRIAVSDTRQQSCDRCCRASRNVIAHVVSGRGAAAKNARRISSRGSCRVAETVITRKAVGRSLPKVAHCRCLKRQSEPIPKPSQSRRSPRSRKCHADRLQRR